jgi:hypothetical protein
MIQLRKTLEVVRNLFCREKIDFALIGGFALSAHGIHRATKDIDILVDGSRRDDVKKLILGAGFVSYHDTAEILQLEGFGYLDIIFANRPLSLEMLKQCQGGIKLAGVPVVSREGIIGLKIQAFKNDKKRELQDKADIQALLRGSGVNLQEVKKYADLFDAWPEVEALLK